MSSVASGYLSSIRQLVEDARRTDYIMPVWLPFLPYILGVALVIVAVASAFEAVTGGSEEASLFAVGALGVGALLVIILAWITGIYVLYKWIDRRNKHFSRVQRLYENIVNYLESIGINDPEVAQIRSMVQEMRYRETQRSPALWIILTILVNIVILYVFHFLTRDFYEHEMRETSIYRQLSALLRRHGIQPVELQGRIPDRNTVLYIVLTIITLGLFGIYWVYVITKDPNEHFIEHARVEQELVRALEALTPPG